MHGVGCISLVKYPFCPVSASYWRFLGTRMGSNLCLKFPAGLMSRDYTRPPNLKKILKTTDASAWIIHNVQHIEQFGLTISHSMISCRI